MPSLKVPDQELYFEIAGEAGPWITLINGHTRTHRDFKVLVQKLRAQNFRVLSLDNRGSGLSQSPGPFPFAAFTADIEALWKHLDINASHLLGISMGGEIAQKLASLRPSLVLSLVLVSTTPNQDYFHNPAKTGWASELDEIAKQLSCYFAPSFREKNQLLLKSMAREILRQGSAGFNTQASYQREAIATFDIKDALSTLKVPTLILHGNLDEVISVQAAEDLAQRIPGSILKIYPEIGHLLLAECPQQFYTDLIDFFDRQRSYQATSL